MNIFLRKNIPLFTFDLGNVSRRHYLKALSLTLPSLFLLVSLLVLANKMTDLTAIKYVAAVDTIGRPLTVSTLKSSLYSDKEVGDWLTNCSTYLFDFSTGSVRQSLSDLSLKCFTTKGYEQFYGQIKDIGLLSWITKKNRFSFFSAEGVELSQNGISENSGRYKWRFTVKGNLIRVDNRSDFRERYQFVIDIQRVSRLGHDMAIRITRIQAEKI